MPASSRVSDSYQFETDFIGRLGNASFTAFYVLKNFNNSLPLTMGRLAIHLGRCKISNTRCLQKKALTNRAAPDQTAQGLHCLLF